MANCSKKQLMSKRLLSQVEKLLTDEQYISDNRKSIMTTKREVAKTLQIKDSNATYPAQDIFHMQDAILKAHHILVFQKPLEKILCPFNSL